MMDSDGENLVTTADLEAFERDGVVVIRNAFGEHWLENLAHGVEQNIRAPGPDATRYTPEGAPGKFYDDYCNWQRIEEYRRFAFDSPLLPRACPYKGTRDSRGNALASRPALLRS